MWHQLTIDAKPTSNVRGLGMTKIAKLCDIEKPLEIIGDMIELKNTRLAGLASEYGVEIISKMIFEDTKEIDKIFRRK
ncbi:MAG: hypothetical protein Q9M32_03245 [Sulfurimonas sp.]|nr:hypothetical protein [Sulfurimonas sp.]